MLESAGPREDLDAPSGGTFEEFFRTTYTRLAQMMLLVAGNRDDAEDLAQESMARVFERWDKVRHMESPAGYVYRTALNLQRKKFRRDAVRSRREVAAKPAVDLIEAATSRHAIEKALSSLPRGQREALVLVEWIGLDAGEAGAILGIKPVSVRGRVHRARTALRETLGGWNE